MLMASHRVRQEKNAFIWDNRKNVRLLSQEPWERLRSVGGPRRDFLRVEGYCNFIDRRRRGAGS